MEITSMPATQMGTPGGAGLIVMAIVLPIVFFAVAFSILVYSLIFRKTGYPWPLGFLVLVPFGSLIIQCILAFTDWPVLRRLRQLEEQSHPQA